LAIKKWQRQDHCHNLFAGDRYHFGFRDLRALAYVDPMALFSNAPALVMILGMVVLGKFATNPHIARRLSAYQNSLCVGRTAYDLSDPICGSPRNVAANPQWQDTLGRKSRNSI